MKLSKRYKASSYFVVHTFFLCALHTADRHKTFRVLNVMGCADFVGNLHDLFLFFWQTLNAHTFYAEK